MSAATSLVGARRPRVEDDRLLAGRGRYVADLRRAGTVDVAFLRSELAHARLLSVDVEAAATADGVVDVVAAADLAGVQPVADCCEWARPVGAFPLVRERVRHVGAPLAAVVAEDRYLAEDALELIAVELEPLPAVTTIDAALAPGAPLLYDGWSDNRIVHEAAAPDPAVDAAFARLPVVAETYTVQRQAAMPMETRGVLAELEDGRLTVWSSTQLPHLLRTVLAEVLQLPERDIRVVAPDVGGGFGGKAQLYPEEYLIPWLALRLGRPVRWIEDRHEHMVSACHGRDMRMALEAAVEADGTIAALRGSLVQDVGAGDLYPGGYGPAFVAWGQLTGPYRIPHQQVDVTAVVTTKTAGGAYRGYGFPEAAFAIERLVDKAAAHAGVDRLELRRRMIVEPGDLPYVTAAGARIDSGSHRAALDRCAELGAAACERVRARHRGDRLRIGLGVSTYVEATGTSYFGTSGRWTGHDACDIRFDSDGGATVAVAVSTTGQGIATMVATLAADELGLPLERVRVAIGDTDVTPHGLGGHSSRSTIVMAGAIAQAAAPLREKGRRIAAHLLEAAPQDVDLGTDGFVVRGGGGSVPWREIAQRALGRTFELPDGVEPGLSSHATWEAAGVDSVADANGRVNQGATYTNAAHAAVVGVDPDTGFVHVLDYVVVHDCGRLVNPLVVAGQIEGGVAQGIAGALYEEVAYDDDGQPLTTTFMTYLIPTATEIPAIALDELESPAPTTVRGVKGVGETGVIGCSAAIAAAVEDALADVGIDHINSTPIAPAWLLRRIDAARAAEHHDNQMEEQSV